jgi:hypothetical protein
MRATALAAVRLGQNIVSKSGGESAWVSRAKQRPQRPVVTGC